MTNTRGRPTGAPETKFTKERSKKDGPRINEEITGSEIRLIGEEEQFGVVTLAEARRISLERGLDLVEVSPSAKPPVVKLIDYGKYKYQQQKKATEAKKKQIVIDVKEIKLRPGIDVHDLNTKLKNVQRFLAQGDKVKMYMQFRGRELAHKDLGLDKFKEIIKTIVEQTGAVVESEVKMMGNRAFTMLSPGKK